MYDITIVGAGLFGATVASRLSDEGMKVLVIDKRNHIAGNIAIEKAFQVSEEIVKSNG